MQIALKVKTGVQQIISIAQKRMKTEVLKRTKKFRVILENQVKKIILEELVATDTYLVLTNPNSELVAELGLEDPKGKIDSILHAFVESIDVSFPVVAVQSIRFSIRSGGKYPIMLGHPEATYTSESSGEVIPWLEWLLRHQDFVMDYVIRFGSYANSRTGHALMYRKPGAQWILQGPHAGSISDNFVEEALIRAQPRIEHMVETTIARTLQGGF